MMKYTKTKLPVYLAGIILIAGLAVACSSNRNGVESQLQSRMEQIKGDISADSIEVYIRKLAGFHTRHTLSDTLSDSVGIGAARRWIYSKFGEFNRTNGNRLNIHYDGFNGSDNTRIPESTNIVNIAAVLPGTQLESKDRMYVVSGHYDSRLTNPADDSSYAPGANDNASGTAAVLELARVLSGYEFDATIIFLAVAGKEQGLLGARNFAKKARKRHLNIDAMFSNDIIGNPTSSDGTIHDRIVRVFAEGIPANFKLSRDYRKMLAAGGENDTPTRQLGRFIYEMSDQYMKDFSVNLIYRKDRFLKKGDHEPFLEKGYAAVRFTEPHEHYRHQHQEVRTEGGIQYGDLPGFINFDYVADVTRLNAVSLAMLANAPARPRKVSIDIGNPTNNNTTLQWKTNSEPDIHGYEIVWRKFHQPFWEYSRFAGDTTRVTLEGVSKDNYQFGVRSVDQYGHKSPAVYPLPVR